MRLHFLGLPAVMIGFAAAVIGGEPSTQQAPAVNMAQADETKASSAEDTSAVHLDTTTGTLFGTLDLPEGKGPWPVVLIIAGSGPTDRDGNSQLMRNDSLKLLGRALVPHGVAALRYDKRGIGESARAGRVEEKLRFENYVDDAAGWVTRLRGDPRFSKIAIIGHSEGSLIGILAAKQARIDAFVSLEGGGRDIATILREQLRGGLSADLFAQSTQIIDELKAGRRIEKCPPELSPLFRPSVQPYLMSLFKYDPAHEIADLSIPILVVQGTTDLQVSVEDAKLLASSNKGARLATIENMNHVLKDAPLMTKAAQLSIYADPSLPLAASLTDVIWSFLKENLADQQK